MSDGEARYKNRASRCLQVWVLQVWVLQVLVLQNLRVKLGALGSDTAFVLKIAKAGLLALHDHAASATPASVKIRAAIWPGPSDSCSASADTTTPMTGTAMVPIAAIEAGSRSSAANQAT
jgi:hypothetical protein